MLRFLVFRLGEQTYAIPAERVKEIVSDLPCFPVPFTPDWVSGVLNRQGVPYTILDPQMLLSSTPTPQRFHLLLHAEDDHIALAISEVREIAKLPPEKIRRLTSREGAQLYFQGSLSLDLGEVFVFDVNELLKKLADDVRSA